MARAKAWVGGRCWCEGVEPPPRECCQRTKKVTFLFTHRGLHLPFFVSPCIPPPVVLFFFFTPFQFTLTPFPHPGRMTGWPHESPPLHFILLNHAIICHWPTGFSRVTDMFLAWTPGGGIGKKPLKRPSLQGARNPWPFFLLHVFSRFFPWSGRPLLVFLKRKWLAGFCKSGSDPPLGGW